MPSGQPRAGYIARRNLFTSSNKRVRKRILLLDNFSLNALFRGLPYLPAVYPGELLYSFIARLSNHGGWKSNKVTSILLNVPSGQYTSVRSDLPTQLNVICSKFSDPKLGDPEFVFSKMTLYPYYLAFRSSARRTKFKTQALEATHRSVGRLPAYVRGHRLELNSHLKFCPQCNDESERRYGEYYWKRAHQLPFVDFCFEHNEFLRFSLVPTVSPKGIYEAANRHNCPDDAPMSIKAINKMLDPILIEFWSKLIDIMDESENRDYFSTAASRRDILANLGFATPHKKIIDYDKLSLVSYAYFSNMYDIYPELDFSSENNAWSALFSSSRSQFSPPVYHVLLDMLIARLGVWKVGQPNYSDKPFGVGPWSCPNRLTCSPQTQDVRLDGVSYQKGTYSGRFRCTCGYEYTFTKSIYNKPSQSFVRSVGHTVEAFLLQNQDISSSYILQKLPISYLHLCNIRKRLRIKLRPGRKKEVSI